MINLSKKFTRVEKKKDGTLLYHCTGVFSFFGKQTEVYVIDHRTHFYLKIFLFIGILIIVPFFVWLKVNHPNLNFTNSCILLISAFTLAKIECELTNNFVKKRAIAKYEE